MIKPMTPRYKRIMEAFPFLSSGDVRVMLIFEVRRLEMIGELDPSNMSDQLEEHADLLISQPEENMRNYIEFIRSAWPEPTSSYDDFSPEDIAKLEASYAEDS